MSTEVQRAINWIGGGDTGLSSKTIWNYFMGVDEFDISIPYDLGDFGRCYKLLKVIPEWKSQINELYSLSNEWNSLVKNWDKLSELYEKFNTSEDSANSIEEFSKLIRSCRN